MRTKGFIIFIIIFTIVYFISLYIYDKLSVKLNNKKIMENASDLIDMNVFIKFANFYNLQVNVTKEIIVQIYMDVRQTESIKISFLGEKYKISNIEFVVIVLYLEYLKLIKSKNISLDNNFIKDMSYKEQNMVNKYSSYFNDKKDCDFIRQNVVGSSMDELNIISSSYLVPGVRMIDSKLYYVGDYL